MMNMIDKIIKKQVKLWEIEAMEKNSKKIIALLLCIGMVLAIVFNGGLK